MHFQPGASLILGGARSGKSAFAERLAAESARQKIYLATSQALDSEMDQRIAVHRERRGPEWKLIEEPVALCDQLDYLTGAHCCVLVDCLTLWLTNLMMAGQDCEVEYDKLAETTVGLSRDASVLFVSNEVGQGIVPMEKTARDFRDHAGRMHQKLAEACQNVWLVTAGLPQKLK